MPVEPTSDEGHLDGLTPGRSAGPAFRNGPRVRRYAPRMGAGKNDGGPRITAKVVRLRSKRFRSALALAESVGAPVFEPSWWPEDTGKVSYRLDGAAYWIGSTRRGGTPIGVVGKAEKPELRLPVGNWSPLPDLEAMRGLVSTSDDHVRAVVQQEQQTIHLIGYASEAELVQAVKSFRRVPAESD